MKYDLLRQNTLSLLSRILLIIAVAAFGGAAFTSCDKMPGNDGTEEYLEDDYVPVTELLDDWSGDYVVAHVIDTKSVGPFAALDGSDGKAGKALKIRTGGVLWGSSADDVKTVLKKADEYSYIMHVAGVGYIGYDGNCGFIRSYTESTDDAYLWDVLLSEGGTGYVQISPKSADETTALVWDSSKETFTVSATGTPAVLFRRVEATGIKNHPDPNPDPKPDPNPDPNPDPDPKPTDTDGYGWFELPAISSNVTGNYRIDKKNSDLYYAYHLCNGNEKYAHSGKRARNYTVCFSASHHCPVWVAAIRHNSLHPIDKAKRTDAYGKDPYIPSNIQYSSKKTGGGCNKGHMLGSKERTSSTETNKQVFYYSNIAPQDSDGFNTGGAPWNTLEDWVDTKVCSDSLYIVIGCYFDKYTDIYGKTNTPKKIQFGGRSDVSMPTMFYYAMLRTKKGNTGKSVTQCSANELQCVAYVLRHETNAKEKGVNYKLSAKDMMSVSKLESLTGFKYFVNVPNAPKTTFNASDWGL